MQTVGQFIEHCGLTMTATPADTNPNMASDRDHAEMDHWRCIMRFGQRARLTVPFSKGSGHHGTAPDLAEVLDCLASDSAGASSSFEDWCGEYGQEEDSRKAERTYRTCVKQAKALQRFLGESRFQKLLYCTERQ